MKTAYRMCIARMGRDGIESRGPAEDFRSREEGYEEMSDHIAYDDRFIVEIVEVQVSDKAYKRLRK